MRRQYSIEYKTEAVKLVLEQGLTPAQAARDLGVAPSTYEKWLKAATANRAPEALTVEERAELKKLRKEVYHLRMERDILKKATAYFSRASLPDTSGL